LHLCNETWQAVSSKYSRCTICMQYRVNLRELWYRSAYINVAAGCKIWGSDTGGSKKCIFYPKRLDRPTQPPI
jgi:hypothetical protein